MKILTSEEQDQILKLVTACQIIAEQKMTKEDINAFTKMTQNLCEISIIVGGQKGAKKVLNSIHEYYDEQG